MITFRGAVVATVAAFVPLTMLVDNPDPSGKGPVRSCYESARPDHGWDCFLPGDLPLNYRGSAYPVWVGHEADIPEGRE